MASTGEQITQRFKDAKARIETFHGVLEEVFDYCLPHRDAFNRGDVGTAKAARVVDATASMAYMDLAGDYQLGLTPPNEMWAKQELEPGARDRLDLSDEESKRTLGELDAQTEEIFRFIRQSNFDTEIHEAFLDMVASTGALLVNEGDDVDPLQFKAVPAGQFVPEEGPHGRVETVFREHEVRARNLNRQWPDAAWTAATLRAIQTSPETKVGLVEATIFNPESRKYEYSVVETGKNHVALEQDFDVTPWVVFRSNVVPGEVLGRGPAVMALPDIKSLNEAVRLTLENATWAIVGAYQTDDYGVVNMNVLTLDAGVIIPIEPGSKGIRPIERSGDFLIADAMIARLSEAVKGYFLRMQLPPTDAPVRTATEIGTRAEVALNRIGPPTTRVYSELIRPLWGRIRDILLRKGLIARIDGIEEQDIRIVPVSPFAQVAAQARARRAFASFTTAAQIAQDETVQLVDLTKFVQEFLLAGDFPASLFRTENDSRQIAIAQGVERGLEAALQGGNGAVPAEVAA